MPDKTQVEIPYALLEYTAEFKVPIIESWAAPAYIASSVLSALGPFGFNLDGVEVKTRAEKLNEYGLIFKRTPPGVTFSIGIGKLTITAENLDWSDAEQFISGARAGIDAVIQRTKAEIGKQRLNLGMHIQSKTKPRQEVAMSLLSPAALQLMDGEVKFPGIILIREKASIIIDGSMAYANGLFVRILREHPEDRTFEEMASVLHADEEKLFETLNLEGAL